jgi:hypothetical protein
MLSKEEKVQAEHKGWDFDTAFRHVISMENHTGSFGRPTKEAWASADRYGKGIISGSGGLECSGNGA